MQKLGVALVLVLVFCGLGIAEAQLIHVKYDSLPNRLEGTPVFCANEPPVDPNVPESLVPLLMKRTKSNIDAWVGPLKSISKKDANWNYEFVDIPREKQAGYDYSKCNVVISFMKNPPTGISDAELLGRQYYKDGKSYVEIYYQGYGVCETKDSTWTYWYTCKQDSPKLIVAMEAILRHELGHAMGLGHYISDELYYTRGLGHPSSMMVPVLDLLASPTHLPIDPQLMEIMPVDLQKLKEIYGDGGWGATKISKTEAKQEPLKTISVSSGKTIAQKIVGVIPADLYKKGKIAEISILKPDGNTETQKLAVGSNGGFSYSIMISYKTASGKYDITVNYFGKQIKKLSYVVMKN